MQLIINSFKYLTAIFFTVLLALLSACSSTVDLSQQPPPPPFSAPAYMVGVGDELDISVWKSPELSTQVPVRPDGKVSLPLAGDVQAAGKTPEALSQNITEKLTQYVRNPQVTVVVTSPVSSQYFQRVRVTGAVNEAQSLPYSEGMTILDLVLEAGSVNEFASPNKSRLYRLVDGSLKAFPVKLKDILNKGKLETNYMLAPGDIVTIPERLF